jgi:hypothetical protein
MFRDRYQHVPRRSSREALGSSPWLRWPECAPNGLGARLDGALDLDYFLRHQASRAFGDLTFFWRRAVCERARAVIRGDAVEPWPLWRAVTVKPTNYGRAPAFEELSHLSCDELVRAVAALRNQFSWLNMRRQRMYERPLPLYLLDPLFCQWIRSLEDDVAAAFAARYLGDSAAQVPVNMARVRLALLRPMPLDLLRPFHAYQCAHTDVLAGCETEHDVCLEYATLYLAIHGCRALAHAQRVTALYATLDTRPFTTFEFTRMMEERRALRRNPRALARAGNRNSRGLTKRSMNRYRETPFPGASKVRLVYRNGRAQGQPQAVDLQALPEPVVHKLLALVKRGKAQTGEPLTWRVVVGPKCSCCQEAEAVDPERAPPASLPPYGAGCACVVIFDPENDPFMVARWDEDMALRRDVACQSMRMVLGAVELAAQQVAAPR